MTKDKSAKTQKTKKKITEEKAREVKIKKEKKVPVKKVEKKPKLVVKPTRYFEAVGRRKTAVARVRLFTRGEKLFLVNEKSHQNYFPTLELQQTVEAPLRKMNCFGKFRILAKVKGGGLSAQAEAIRHGVARALTLFNPDFRKRLKAAGYLTRDPRMRERKKFGLKRARRAPQWQKR